MLGWFTRPAALLSVLCTAALAVVFFAADFNKLYVALLVLLITALLPVVMLGPGKSAWIINTRCAAPKNVQRLSYGNI